VSVVADMGAPDWMSAAIVHGIDAASNRRR